MTKKTRALVALVLSVVFTTSATAQEVNATTTSTLSNCQARFDESAPQRIMPTRYGGRLRKLQKAEEPSYDLQPTHNDSLHLPMLNTTTASPVSRYPFGWGCGFNSWALHRGLNVQLGASVFAAFGKGAQWCWFSGEHSVDVRHACHRQTVGSHRRILQQHQLCR